MKTYPETHGPASPLGSARPHGGPPKLSVMIALSDLHEIRWRLSIVEYRENMVIPKMESCTIL